MSQKSVNGSYWQSPPGARNQILLIPTSLEEKIPENHPVRLLDEILDGLDWTTWENTYNRKLGQPPIHPSILCKVLLFAMIRRIRSSRSIEYQIEHSVDFMWLVSGRTIDHSTISDFRREHKKELKDIHRQMLGVAIDMGVARLSELCIDGTRVLANASRHKTWTADRVEKLLKELDIQIETGPNISGLEDRGIEFLSPLSEVKCDNNPALREDPRVPVAADDIKRLPINPQSKRFDKSAFVYDAEADRFHCPAGKTLSRAGTETRQTAGGPVLHVIYFGDECEGCELAPQCRQNPESERGRKVTRDEHEEARERHREQMGKPESADRYKQRQHFGEMPFAVMKVCFDMRRFLLRGLAGVQAEWQWCCTAFNLKKLMNLLAALRAEQRKTAKIEI